MGNTAIFICRGSTSSLHSVIMCPCYPTSRLGTHAAKLLCSELTPQCIHFKIPPADRTARRFQCILHLIPRIFSAFALNGAGHEGSRANTTGPPTLICKRQKQARVYKEVQHACWVRYCGASSLVLAMLHMHRQDTLDWSSKKTNSMFTLRSKAIAGVHGTVAAATYNT